MGKELFFLFDELVQPIVNQTKHTEPFRNAVSRRSAEKGITGCLASSAGPQLQDARATDPHYDYLLLLSQASRSPSFPQLAFFISRVLYFSQSSFPTCPPSTETLCASIATSGSSVVTIFPGKGSDILGNASGSGTRYWTRRIQAQAILFFGVVLFLALWCSFLVLLITSNSLVQLWKIDSQDR